MPSGGPGRPGRAREVPEPKAIWEVRGSGHAGGIDAQPEQYERRVVAFFDRHLLTGK